MTVTVAVLAEDRSLIGFATKPSPAPGDIVVPAGCDLATDGRYRWHDTERRFDPIAWRLLEVGDTAAFNKMVLGVLAGVIDEAKAPVEVLDTAAFIRRAAPGDGDALGRLVAAEGQRLLKRMKARGRPRARKGR